jgi:hypothetical protein
LTGLLPLFDPIVRQLRGKVFSSNEFSQKVCDLYGININPYAVEDLVPRLVKAGMLKRAAGDRSGSIYTYEDALSNHDDYREFDDILANIITRFKLFASRISPIFKPEYTDEEVDNIFIDTIINQKIDENLLDVISSATPPRDVKQTSLAYLVGRFIIDLEKNHPELVSDLAQISAAAMVSEVVLDLRRPPDRNRKFPTLKIIVDGPIAMGLMGLSGDNRKKNLTAIFNQIKESHCGIAIFNHSIDEIRNMIFAVLESDSIVRGGPFGDALKNGEILEEYAREILRNTEHFIKELGIQIDTAQPVRDSRAAAFFNDPLLLRFKEELVGWTSDLARERDARSVAYVMRYRKGNQANDSLRTGYLFLTENGALERLSRGFCVANDLVDHYQAGPVIHLRRLAALLWITLGGVEERHELSRRQLLANCALAIRSRQGIIGKMTSTLRRVRPEMVGQFQTLLSLPRSSRLAMDVAVANDELIDDSNIEQVISVVRRATIEEETIKFEEMLADREGIVASQRQEFNAKMEEIEAQLLRERAIRDETTKRYEEENSTLLKNMQSLRQG